ncbi:hypothetical protein CN074_13325 [Sinorhizobium medicae]|nr:hypothetical protein CN201_15975 [Sinorhizobium medicae]RVJ79299.1 hypothetical protein CN168_16955 [Sinorhizobium medicae]RVK16395.1 hypothetical protein CN165_19210 [Sinorhizobium medicae]RVO70938.1 hypothetical protein CN084_30125 [Sinorhizobium medicae]RVP68288.1 hypothetical protein CN074_13325 [Sinorhizobium medicae]
MESLILRLWFAPVIDLLVGLERGWQEREAPGWGQPHGPALSSLPARSSASRATSPPFVNFHDQKGRRRCYKQERPL